MVPSTWLSVVLFFLLVAPRLLFYLLAERRRVGAQESAFREVSRVVLASLAFTTVGLVAVAVVRVVHPTWMPDPRVMLRDGHRYLNAHYSAVGWAFVVAGGASLVSAIAVHYVLAKGKKGPPLRQVSAWTTVLREECPADCVPYIRIRQTDGSVLEGYVGYYSRAFDQADREIVLTPPLFARRAKDELHDVPANWQRVVVAGSTVATLSVQYRPKPKPPSTS